ncbi:MAG TPA: site-specific integrase [Acidimicrobiales bacterium]|nr:site-specific integrase [Acidimicrobiales bacterium]
MTNRRHFGSVRKLPSGRYQAGYWHRATRHLAPETFAAKGDAQRWLSNVETSIHRGDWVDPAGGRMTVAELAARWTERDPSKRSSTRVRDEAILRLHILPTLGTSKVREVTPPDIQRLVNLWAQAKAPRTVDRQYDVLRALFGYATRSDWLARSPCRDIRLPVPTDTRRRNLSVDEVIALAGAIDPRYEAMVWLGAVLGLRWAEVAGLTVGSLDFLRATVTVSQQLGRDQRLGPPKSSAGRRQFSIPVELTELIAKHLAARELNGAEPGRLVFTTPRGRPLDYSRWRARVWIPALAACGLDGAGFHDLRRANASALVAAGVDVKTAQSRLGHSDPRLTLGIYAQFVPEADRAAAVALGQKFFGPRTDRARQSESS